MSNNYFNNIYRQPLQFGQYAYVNGIDEAKNFPVPPNTTMLLMESNEPIIYMKATNYLGNATFKTFKLVEIAEPAKPQYVTIDDFNKLKEELLNAKSVSSNATANANAKQPTNQ